MSADSLIFCTTLNCGGRVLARGLCNKCYQRLRRQGLLLPPALDKSSPPCSVPGCEQKSMARGFCRRHYHRWRRSVIDAADGK